MTADASPKYTLLFSLHAEQEVVFGDQEQTIQGLTISEWLKPLLLMGMSGIAFHHVHSPNHLLLIVTRAFDGDLDDFVMEYDLGLPILTPPLDKLPEGYIERVFVTIFLGLIEFCKDIPVIFHNPEILCAVAEA